MIRDGKYNFKWIGLLAMDDSLSDSEQAKVLELFKQKNCYPLIVDHKQLEPFIIFFESVVRPLFHNFKSLYEDKTNIENKEFWNNYLFINKAFANKIIEVKNLFADKHPKMVWVHDCHLLMVPIYVKKVFPEANIGFYLHTPFPSSDIFRMFQFRFDIL
jgi:trehalose 6-phosphate synthase/phosphatase